MAYTGFGIALAWPQTYCKQAGAWYDPITSFFGFNKNNYYKAGHAALVLINDKGVCYYFDFGRYHAPHQHGRVRCSSTDFDLIVNTKAVLKKKEILNYGEVLNELQQNPACHGEGELHAGYTRINFEKAYAKAIEMVEKEATPYGPFVRKGTNCSRFVNTVLQAGKINFWSSLKMNYYVPFTPTPLNNVRSLKSVTIIPQQLSGDIFYPECKLTKERLQSILPAPEKTENLPKNAQWLGGEGGGSWFSINKAGSFYQVTRFSLQGIIECEGLFKTEKKMPVESLKNITYPSHCQKVSLSYDDEVYVLTRMEM